MILARIRLGGMPKGGTLVLPMITEAGKKTRWTGVPTELAERARKGGGPEVGSGVSLVPAGESGYDLVLRLDVRPDEEANPFEWFRSAGAGLQRCLRTMGVAEAAMVRPTGGRSFQLEAFCEGVHLAGYRFSEYLSAEKKKDKPTKLLVVSKSGAADRQAVKAAEAIAGDVCFGRDLVNRAAADLNPESFAAEARRITKRKGMSCKVIAGKPLVKGFPAIHAVGKGSRTPPRLIRVDWDPGKRKAKHYVLVGKGITYDSGGYHVKTLDSMFLMKKDMAGAAAVLAAVDAAARLKLGVKVTALLATAENMISRDSFRPGDVIDSRIGKTIEVRSTDAEGRLVLADALTYASELEPDGIIDLATLTGIAGRFLGTVMAPLMGNDEKLCRQIHSAGAHVHERVLHLPLLREYRDATRGVISDLRNWGKVGGFGAGTMVAGGFLSHFVGKTPWAHMDMSNASWAYSEGGYLSYGGTAWGVRLLVDFLARQAAGKG